jgi:glutathione peroxidase-family protein
LSKFHEKYKARGFQVLAVDADDADTPQMVSELVAKLKLTHPIVLRGEAASELYSLEAIMPTAFWIDRNGRVVLREVGFLPEMEKEIERRINDLLEGRPEAAKS